MAARRPVQSLVRRAPEEQQAGRYSGLLGLASQYPELLLGVCPNRQGDVFIESRQDVPVGGQRRWRSRDVGNPQRRTALGRPRDGLAKGRTRGGREVGRDENAADGFQCVPAGSRE